MNKPVLHNEHLHKVVLSYLSREPKGFVLDIPSGPGYLMLKLKESGFKGIACEIDDRLHLFKNIEYKKVDMSKEFPFKDNSIDHVASIEGIEHIENHFSFIREVARVLRPGGTFIMTTPNVHNLESRLNFFLSGFHSLADKPISLCSKNMYFEHINPMSFESLYFIMKKSGFDIETLTSSRYRKGALFLYYLLFPIIYLASYRACFLKEKDKNCRKQNKEIFKLLISKANLAGGHSIVIARKRS